MREMFYKILAWFREEKGQDMIEYALISALLSLVIVVAAAGVLEGSFTNWANWVAEQINGVAGGT